MADGGRDADGGMEVLGEPVMNDLPSETLNHNSTSKRILFMNLG